MITNPEMCNKETTTPETWQIDDCLFEINLPLISNEWICLKVDLKKMAVKECNCLKARDLLSGAIIDQISLLNEKNDYGNR